MTNKEKIKKAIEEDINPQMYYKQILKEIEKGEKMPKNNMWKWSIVPICLGVIISGFLFINYQNDNKTILKNKPYVDEKNNVTLNINEINKAGMPLLDADVKVVTNNAANFPLPYKNGIVDIPKDLDKTSKYIFYFREDKESKEYNKLGFYEIIYDDGDERSIKVSYAKDNKPTRDYYFSEEGSKITTINGINLKIYKFASLYFTEFKYNDYYFDIETSNITEQELSALLLSILKWLYQANQSWFAFFMV